MNPKPTEARSSTDWTALALSDRVSERLRKALTAYMLTSAAGRLVKVWVNRARSEATYSVAVGGDDELYPEVHRWVLETMPPARRRAVIVRSTRRGDDKPVDVGEETPKSLKVFYDGTRTQSVVLDGHKVTVRVDRPDWSQLKGDSENMPRWLQAAERIIFTAQNLAGREAVLRFLAQLADKMTERQPRLWIAQRYGGWNRRSELPGRDLNTVVLRAGQREALVDDLGQFLQQERDYARLGVGWYRGYLFSGAPGVGKTSIAKALAGHFGMDVYFIPLSSIPNDSTLLELLSGIKPRSMLLLEDIDIVHGSHERSDTDPGVTLSGLLNGLDGLVTPHGLVTVMTTNNGIKLDPALTRPGRMDRHDVFSELDDDQFHRLVTVFLGRPVDLPPLRGWVTPAEAMDVVKCHIADPEAAAIALKELAER